MRRTRRALAEALVELVVEQGYDRTTVQDVLDRADVGRSTFYAHYRDKDALLMAAFEEMTTQLRADLDAMEPGGSGLPAGSVSRVHPEPGRPASALFGHAYRNQPFYTALCGRRGDPSFRRRLHDVIAALLREHLAPHLAAARTDLPPEVVAQFAASAAIGLLVWWVDDGFRQPPQRMAQWYQRLVAPGIVAALG